MTDEKEKDVEPIRRAVIVPDRTSSLRPDKLPPKRSGLPDRRWPFAQLTRSEQGNVEADGGEGSPLSPYRPLKWMRIWAGVIGALVVLIMTAGAAGWIFEHMVSLKDALVWVVVAIGTVLALVILLRPPHAVSDFVRGGFALTTMIFAGALGWMISAGTVRMTTPSGGVAVEFTPADMSEVMFLGLLASGVALFAIIAVFVLTALWLTLNRPR